MNYDETAYEETIDLKDLCIYILRRWRVIVAAALVFAVLLGGYRYWTESHRPEELTESEEQSLEDSEAAIKDNQTAQKTAQAAIDKDRKTIELMTKNITAQENVRVIHERDLKQLETLLEECESIEDRAMLIVEINTISVQLEDVTTQIADYQDSIADCETDIVAQQELIAQLAEKESALKEYDAQLRESLTKEEPAPVSAGTVAKYMVLGAVAGVFLVCVIAFLRYLLGGKLRGGEELKERYGIRVLGSLYRTPVRHRRGVDRLLDRFDDNGKAVEEDQVYALIAAGLQVLNDRSSVKLFITGTPERACFLGLQENLEKLLPSDSFRVEAIENPVYHADAMLKIRDGVLLLAEKPGVTKKKELDRLAELLTAAKAEVAGAVLL